MGSTASEWDWAFSPRADDQFARLEAETQERTVEKLDDVVSSEWRDPDDFLEPLANSPYRKLRVGNHRLGCRVRRQERILRVESIRHRSGAYTADDRPPVLGHFVEDTEVRKPT